MSSIQSSAALETQRTHDRGSREDMKDWGEGMGERKEDKKQSREDIKERAKKVLSL